MSNAMIYAGISISIATMAEIMIYAHDNQQDYLPKDPTPQAATDQDVIVPSDLELPQF